LPRALVGVAEPEHEGAEEQSRHVPTAQPVGGTGTIAAKTAAGSASTEALTDAFLERGILAHGPGARARIRTAEATLADARERLQFA
jgi:hypothetical protein